MDQHPLEEIRTKEKIQHLVQELIQDLGVVERQEKLGLISAADAESIRKSIVQSIAELKAIPSGELLQSLEN